MTSLRRAFAIGAMGAAIVLKTAFFWLFCVFWVGLIAYVLPVPIAIVERLCGRDEPRLALTVLHRCTGWARIFYRMVAELRIETNERAPEGSVVVICNHHSFMDLYLLFYIFPRIHMSARRTLFRIPFLGWAMALLGHFPHDAAQPEVAIDAAERWIRRGRYVGILPEGTRAPSGEIGPFRAGAFRVAQRTTQRVQPVVVVGTGLVWPRGRFWIRKLGPVWIRVLPPVDVPSDLGRQQTRLLIERLRHTMLAEHQRMERELAHAGPRSVGVDSSAQGL